MTHVFLFQKIYEHNDSQPFHLAGYSFGACVAIEMALQINQSESTAEINMGKTSVLKTLLLLDGSHMFVAAHTGSYRQQMTITEGSQAETAALCNFMEKFNVEDLHAVSILPSEVNKYVGSPILKSH